MLCMGPPNVGPVSITKMQTLPEGPLTTFQLSACRESLLQIGDDIADIFDSDREPNCIF